MPDTDRPALTPRDRAAIGMVRWIGKPAISVISSPAILRGMMNRPARWLNGRPEGARVHARDDGALEVTPEGVDEDVPWLMYIHGGGFLAGSPYTHLPLVLRLAQATGCRAILPTYRLSPDHPFPAAREDVIAAYTAHIDAHGAPGALCGDSAGGNLALLVAQHARDAGLPQPLALGLIAPVADLSEDIPARLRAAPDEMLFPAHRLAQLRDIYLQGHDPADPGASPLLGRLNGLPPAVIQASRDEAAAPDAQRLAEGMDAAELMLWPGLPHVWHIFAGRAPVADAALTALGTRLRALIARDAREEACA